MRRACIVLWAGLTAYGLFHLLGLTGLSLACVYVTTALRRCCAEQTIQVELPWTLGAVGSATEEPPVIHSPPPDRGAAGVLGMPVVRSLSPARGACGLGV